ncbi:MAG: glycosyltransferase [Bacteroidales bacterium]|nr:glycosyltransferase [Bacteroidales bacterium]
MCLIEYFSLIIIFIYVLTIVFIFAGWLKLKKGVSIRTGRFPFISVIIAARNEEKNIGRLLEDLTAQCYPSEKFEIIVADDHSGDRTVEIVHQFCRRYPGLIRCIPAKQDNEGKKHALDRGIKSAKGDLILTTDADCRVSPRWISSFTDFYLSENKPKMIPGLVDFEESKGIFMALQNLEFLSLVGSGAGAAGIVKPVYCNAANLFFEKQVYLQMNDPLERRTVSGDDTFLLHHVKKLFPGKIKLLKSSDAMVKTKPAATLNEFFRQRIRWASKARYYKDYSILFLAGIVGITNTAMIGWFAGLFLFGVKMHGWIVLIKILSDWLMITPVLSFFQKKRLHCYVPVLSLLYPFYIVTITIASAFAKVKWKGRVYSNKTKVLTP